MAFDAKITRPGGAAVSLKDYAYIVSYDGLWTPPPFRGEDFLTTSRRGRQFAAQEYDAYTFAVPLELLGSSQADYQDKLASLRALAESSRAAVTFTRVHPTGAGDVTQTCSARCRLSEPGSRNGLLNGRVSVEVTNLDGCWYASSASAPTIPATITVGGTAVTNRITLVLPGAGTLSNTTLGVSVAVTAGATLTVQSKATTGALSAVTASGDPFGNWFALAPGSNTITWSGAGTPTISYYAAHL